MKAHLRHAAREAFLRFLSWKPTRTALREAPLPLRRLKSKQLAVLREGRERATSAEERRRFDARIAAVERQESAYRDLLRADPDRLNRQLAALGELSDKGGANARVRKFVSSLTKEDIEAIAETLSLPEAAPFRFRAAAVPFFTAALAKLRDERVLIAGLKAASAREEVYALLNAYAPLCLGASADGGSLTRMRDACDLKPDLLMVDNGVPLDVAEALQTHAFPEVKVFFANRCAVSSGASQAPSAIRKTWTPIMESACAYFTAEERRLDEAFQRWRAKTDAVLSTLFDDAREDMLGVPGRRAFESLLEDAAYILFREYWSWRAAIWGASDQDGCGTKRVLVLSNRVWLAEALRRDASARGADLQLLFWSPRGDLSFRKEGEPTATAMISQLSSLSEIAPTVEDMASVMKARYAAPERRPANVIFTTSNVRNYIDYAVHLGARLGAPECLIVDTHPAALRNGAREKAVGAGLAYLHAPISASHLETSTEKNLAAALSGHLQNALRRSDCANDAATRLLFESGALNAAAAQLVSLQYNFAYFRRYLGTAPLDAAGARQAAGPCIYFAPGRTPLAMALAADGDLATSIDVQFFMTSRSFRYKRPNTRFRTAIDSHEAAFLDERFALGADSFLAEGSPSVDIYFKNEARRLPPLQDPDEPPCAHAQRRSLLFICQPHRISDVLPVLDTLRRLLESDPRCFLTFKLHSHNSHGLAQVFRSRLGEDASRSVAFDADGDIYELIRKTDLVIGYSSNALIEAASLRKGVVLIDSPYVEMFMGARLVGLVASAHEADRTIAAFFDDAETRRQMRAAQEAYFARNPGMDAYAEGDDFTGRLIAGARRKVSALENA